MSTPTNLTWTHIESAVDYIVGYCKNTLEWQPETVVGIARGGLIPAVMVAHKLEVDDVRSFRLSSYDGDGNKGKVVAYDSLNALIHTASTRRTLIVDDIVDTGDTIKWLRHGLNYGGNDIDCKIASCCLKKFKTPKGFWPDIWAWTYEEPAWVTFPWEPPVKEEEIPF